MMTKQNPKTHVGRPRVAILQPFIPHYRREFLSGLEARFDCTVYCYMTDAEVKKDGFSQSSAPFVRLRRFRLGGLVFFSLLPFLLRRYDVTVLPGAIRQPCVWALLLLLRLRGCKIILWGHGVSIPRYLDEEKKIPAIRRRWYSLADAAWFYTAKELALWRRDCPNLDAVALGNTISGIRRILELPLPPPLEKLKAECRIGTPFNFIFCARFSGSHRHPELLEELIKAADPARYGFIIIGDGPDKPDFSKYKHVYDFGAVYDAELKDSLFAIADVYFQPAWLGLSCIEAMAYGKAILSLERTRRIHQCVEFFYVQDAGCGVLAGSVEEGFRRIEAMSPGEIGELGGRAKDYVRRNLTMEQMVGRAADSIDRILSGRDGGVRP